MKPAPVEPDNRIRLTRKGRKLADKYKRFSDLRDADALMTRLEITSSFAIEQKISTVSANLFLRSYSLRP